MSPNQNPYACTSPMSSSASERRRNGATAEAPRASWRSAASTRPAPKSIEKIAMNLPLNSTFCMAQAARPVSDSA